MKIPDNKTNDSTQHFPNREVIFGFSKIIIIIIILVALFSLSEKK